MKFRIFPNRTQEDKAFETRDAVATCLIFTVGALGGLGLFFFGGEMPPRGSSVWSSVRWIALVVGAISSYGVVMSFLEGVVAATVGTERAIAILAVVVVLGGFASWFFGL